MLGEVQWARIVHGTRDNAGPGAQLCRWSDERTGRDISGGGRIVDGRGGDHFHPGRVPHEPNFGFNEPGHVDGGGQDRPGWTVAGFPFNPGGVNPEFVKVAHQNAKILYASSNATPMAPAVLAMVEGSNVIDAEPIDFD